MLRSLAVMLILLLAGCAAEGQLPDADVGGVPAVNDPDAGGSEDNDTAGHADTTVTDEDAGAWGQPCDPLLQNCPESGKCVPDPQTGNSQCVPEMEGKELGEECSSATQCPPVAVCVRVDPDDPAICVELCDPDGSSGQCSGTAECILQLGSDPSLGLCTQPPASCNIYDQDCPDEDDDCILTRDHEDNIGTFCGEAGLQRNNEPCGDGEGKCAAGKICIDVDGAARCYPVCRNPEDGPEVTCPTGLSCDGVASASGITFCK